jgi:mono/diheme cytochrome c family protein
MATEKVNALIGRIGVAIIRMISARMGRRAKIAIAATATAAATALIGACGTQGIQVAQSDPNYRGAKLFLEHCSGCHSLDVVGARGSALKIRDRERVNGPNFNVRKEEVSQVLYAIRNWGFSGAIMPENVLVGADAQAVAQFLAKYSGLKRPKIPTAH